MDGMMLGLVSYHGKTMVAIRTDKETTYFLEPEYALLMFNQLGAILEALGLGDDEDEGEDLSDLLANAPSSENLQ